MGFITGIVVSRQITDETKYLDLIAKSFDVQCDDEVSFRDWLIKKKERARSASMDEYHMGMNTQNIGDAERERHYDALYSKYTDEIK